MTNDRAQARRLAERQHYEARIGLLDMASYDWTSGAARVVPLLRSPYEHLERWLATRCANRAVLDFGCGQGLWLMHPAACGASVVGLDLSPTSLQVARRRADTGGGGVQLVCGDCENLPFPAHTFDIVMSCGTLSCLELARAADEIARVLRPTGEAIIVDTLGHNPVLNAHRRRLARRGLRTPQTVQHILRADDVARLCERFERCTIRHFDLLTVAASAVLRDPRTQLAWGRWLARADRALLKLPGLRRAAFKVVVELAGPRP